MTRTPHRCPHRESGYALVAGIFLVLLVGGLALGLIEEGRAARMYVAHHENNLRALEMAEIGLVRAETEIRAQVDLGTPGIGNVAGGFGNGQFAVTVHDDPVSSDRWVLQCSGTYGLSTRRIEVGVRRRRNTTFADALFSLDDLTLGNTKTDAYDSRIGTYAGQAVNNDAGGPFAEPGGNVGSNSDIYLDGTSVWVRGNAIPGPLRETHLSGGPTVFGDRMPRQYEFPQDPTPYDDFADAMQNNDNGSISSAGYGNRVRYNAARYSLDIAGNTHAVLDGGTYFFKDVFIRGGSILEFSGPTVIYVTGSFEISAGTNLVVPRPQDLVIHAHPYPLPNSSVSETKIKVNGGSQVTWALYGPGAELHIGGGNHFYGAAVAWNVDISGENAFHYDKALGTAEEEGVALMERLYWRELSPPRR